MGNSVSRGWGHPGRAGGISGARAGTSHGQAWLGLGAAGAEGSGAPNVGPSLCTFPSAPGYAAAAISQGTGSRNSLPLCCRETEAQNPPTTIPQRR